MEGPPINKLENEEDAEEFLATSDKKSIALAKKFLLEKNPNILKNVSDGDFGSASITFEKTLGDIDFNTTKEWASFIEAFKEMRVEHVSAVIKSGDVQKMKDLVLRNGLEYIGIKNVAMMPKEVVYSPEIQERMRIAIEEKVGGNYRSNDEDSKREAIEQAHKFIKIGIMKPKDAKNILSMLAVNKK